jgi:hypothetical protein
MLQHLICFVHAGPTLCSSQEILPPLRRRQMPRCPPSQPTPPSATPRAHLGPAFPFCSPPPFPHLHACTTCVPPAPLPASQRWPALPSRMPAHLGRSRLRSPPLPRPACPRTSARPSVAISSSPLHPSVQAHAPQGLGPSRAHLFSPPPPLQAEAMRALTGVLQPTRRLGHSGGDGPAAGPMPARSSRVAADQPARATAALVLAEDDEDNAPLFRERSWKRGRKTRYSA